MKLSVRFGGVSSSYFDFFFFFSVRKFFKTHTGLASHALAAFEVATSAPLSKPSLLAAPVSWGGTTFD